ncbi:MAG: GumC family protein, partial [Bacteroidales bacterium]
MKKTENKDLVDLRQSILIYLQHWRWIAMSLFLCLCIGVAYFKLKDPVYSVSANVVIKEDDSKSAMGASALKNFAFGMGGGADVNDEIFVISSHTTAARAVKKLGLDISYKEKYLFFLKKDKYKNAALVLKPMVPNMVDTLTVGFSFQISVSKEGNARVVGKCNKQKIIDAKFTSLPCRIETAWGAFMLEPTTFYKAGESYDYLISISGYDPVAEGVSKNVQINMVSKKANVIHLSMNTSDVQKGKDILNTIIEIYNKEAIEDKNIVANHTATFLQDRLSIITNELDSIEQKVESYKNLNQFFDVEAESKIMLEQNADFTSKLIEVETQINVVDMLLGYLKSDGGEYLLVPTTLGVTDKAVVESIQQYNQLLLERLKLLQNTHIQNPVVIALEEQISVSRTNVLKSIHNLKDGLKLSSRQIKAQETKITSKYKQAPRIEREFLDIKRRQLLKEQLYLFLMQKNEENGLTLAIT